MTIVELCLEVEGFLGQHRENALSPEEKEKFLVAIDAIRFISASGQSYDFEDYRKSLEANAPPLVIAAFNTSGEAESWLQNHPSPPQSACVLVAGEYYRVICSRELNLRRLRPSPSTLEYYLEDMTRTGLPPPVATFHSRDEATAWLDSQPEPPAQAFIMISGAYYLAVYHYKIRLRAIYPIPVAAAP
jgi:hypothetical protein